MTALAGFGLAVLYAVIVLGGGLFSLIFHTPWVLPVWLFLLPVAAAALSWLARLQIQSAEDTLGGLALARWGLGLSLVLGLSYGAFYTATYFAVRQQASAFGNQWVGLMTEDKIDRAFLLTIPPPRPPDDDELHRALELRYNTPESPTAPGGLSVFGQMHLVRMLAAGGKDTQIELRGVSAWDIKKDAYEITLRYHITTDLVSFDLEVPVVGTVGRGFTGRQWHVRREGVNMTDQRGTEAGSRYGNLAASGQKFAEDWLKRMTDDNRDGTFQDTLPPDEQSRLTKKGFPQVRNLNLPADKMTGETPPGLDADGKEYFEKRKRFIAGDLVQVDKGTFIVNNPEAVIEDVKKQFLPGEGRFLGQLSAVTRSRVFMPDVRLGDPIRSAVPVMLLIPPNLLVEGRLWLEVDRSDADQKEIPWHVASLELLRGRVAPQPGTGPPGMGRPAGMPPPPVPR
jgi:hypothetical protein